MVKHLQGDWQPADRNAYDALPGVFQDILKDGRPIGLIEKDLLFALDFYPAKKQAQIRANIFRCLGVRPIQG